MQSATRAASAIRAKLREHGRLTVLTGAGISAESGVATFRGMGGMWERFNLMDLATPEAFARNPTLVHRFYNERREQLKAVEPNLGHAALAALERALGARFSIITQNVDDLHERAGSKRLWHMHGELTQVRCVRCSVVAARQGRLSTSDSCDRCGGPLRPNIVWFGEVPFFMEHPIPELLVCDVFMSIGTSGVVYPAAGFASAARAHGALTVHVNLEPSSGAFDIDLLGPAAEVLPQLIAALDFV